jgi:Coatomer (COPI) alpha subunit C-terminus
VGVVNFEPLKPYFLELAAGASATLPLLPGVPPLPVSLDRNWSSDAGATPPTAPALVRHCRWFNVKG